MREENFVPGLAFPRIALVLLFLFSNYLQRAYHGLSSLLLGFRFFPFTALASMRGWRIQGSRSPAFIL
jgi:hypothetical protein